MQAYPMHGDGHFADRIRRPAEKRDHRWEGARNMKKKSRHGESPRPVFR